MRAFQKILFPVDMSDSCTATAPFVEAMAKKYNAEVTLLHVLEMPSGLIPDWYGGAVPVIDATAIWQAETETAQSYLTDRFQGLKVHRVVIEGDSAQTIDDYARENGTDLIMMPTHGYGLFRTLLLGSVTAKVLHAAECPVWTGVHMEHVPRLEDISLKRILCAIDLGAQSCPTASWAKKFAAEFGAQLEIVHAVAHATEALAAPEVGSAPDAMAEATEKLKAVQACVGLQGPAFVVGGEVASAVCDCAAREKADLVVIGRSVKGGVLGRLRANAYSIIRQSPCPVVSV